MKPSFPRGPLLGVAALVAVSLGGAGISRIQGGPTPEPTTTAAMIRDVHFKDQPNGALLASDAHDGSVLGIVPPGTNGFLRATMRGMARQRQLEGVGPDPSFRLTAWNDGRLTLDDPSTGRRVDLEAFGSTNEGAFAILLTPEKTQP